jgi:DNA gyrase subunit A
MGRATQGVRLINLRDDDSIASVAKIENGALEEKNAAQFDDENVEIANEGASENTTAASDTNIIENQE